MSNLTRNTLNTFNNTLHVAHLTKQVRMTYADLNTQRAVFPHPDILAPLYEAYLNARAALEAAEVA